MVRLECEGKLKEVFQRTKTRNTDEVEGAVLGSWLQLFQLCELAHLSLSDPDSPVVE